jgi:hypothetical protein
MFSSPESKVLSLPYEVWAEKEFQLKLQMDGRLTDKSQEGASFG